MCAKDSSVIQLHRHRQLPETEFGPTLLTNPHVFGTLGLEVIASKASFCDGFL